jgi:hypothetical protein
MKLTEVLFRANYVKWKRFQWYHQAKRVIRDDGLKKDLESRGFVVRDALKFVEERMAGQIIPVSVHLINAYSSTITALHGKRIISVRLTG